MNRADVWKAFGPDRALAVTETLTGRWYADHENADRATEQCIARLVPAAAVPEWQLGIGRAFGEPQPVGDGCPLTVRELQVLGGIAAGLQTKQIAAVLGVGHETVRTHVKRCYDRLGIAERRRGSRDTAIRAVAMAMREGWL